jgi:hypothetical protein
MIHEVYSSAEYSIKFVIGELRPRTSSNDDLLPQLTFFYLSRQLVSVLFLHAVRINLELSLAPTIRWGRPVHTSIATLLVHLLNRRSF